MKNAYAAVLLSSVLVVSACNNEQADGAAQTVNQVQRVGDAANGRQLFAEKGCVICHAVNGVGGKAAPALDAQTALDIPDPVGFAARMWVGAPAMIELQGLELGYSIYLQPQEIVDLATFAADASEQKNLKLTDLDKGLVNSFLDEQFWEVEDWQDFLENGQEGAGAPPEKTE